MIKMYCSSSFNPEGANYAAVMSAVNGMEVLKNGYLMRMFIDRRWHYSENILKTKDRMKQASAPLHMP